MQTYGSSGKNFSFSKIEKLCSEKLIDHLFKKGDTFFLYPLKIYLIRTSEVSIFLPQILFTVPKKNFKKAVDRNRIKRRLREAYRLNKSLLQNEPGGTGISTIAVVYIAKENIPFPLLQEKLISILHRLKIIRQH